MATLTMALLGALILAALAVVANWIPRPPGLSTGGAVVVLAALAIIVFALDQIREGGNTEAPPHSTIERTAEAASSHERTPTISTPPQVTRSLTVPSDVAVSSVDGGLDTGVAVEAGQAMSITASGRIEYGYEGGEFGDCIGFASTDPDGQRLVGSVACSTKLDPNVPLASAPVGALIGRIGDGPWTLIGSQRTVRADRSGELWLAHNDYSPSDNKGSYAVAIQLQPEQ